MITVVSVIAWPMTPVAVVVIVAAAQESSAGQHGEKKE